MNTIFIFLDIVAAAIFVIWGLVVVSSFFCKYRPVAGPCNWLISFVGGAWLAARYLF